MTILCFKIYSSFLFMALQVPFPVATPTLFILLFFFLSSYSTSSSSLLDANLHKIFLSWFRYVSFFGFGFCNRFGIPRIHKINILQLDENILMEIEICLLSFKTNRNVCWLSSNPAGLRFTNDLRFWNLLHAKRSEPKAKNSNRLYIYVGIASDSHWFGLVWFWFENYT